MGVGILEQNIHTSMQKIGEGRFRNVFGCGPYVLKYLKEKVVKRYGPLTVQYPAAPYTRMKYGITDLNKHEFENYLEILARVPTSMHTSLAAIKGVYGADGNSLLLGSRICDADGSTSPSLASTGQLGDRVFWERFDALEDEMLTHRVHLVNVKAANIVVRRAEDETLSPVLIDYKRFGARTYPFQPVLRLSERAVEAKVRRKLGRIRSSYQLIEA